MRIEQLSLRDIHRQLRTRELSSHALMRACAENYSRHEPATHAYKTWNGEGALNNALAADTLMLSGIDLGPLMGIPVSVKDLYAVPGLPTYAGSSEKLSAAWEQPGDVVQALLRQLTLITGKTHTVEFAFGGIGINAHWGTPCNPWDANDHRVPGGSSSGAGVSLSQGSALLALGTDTAGSVRIPASMTGNVGLKTTQGRWSNTGIVPLSSTLDTAGVLARSVDDAAFGYSAIESMLTGQATQIRTLDSLQGMTFGVPDHFFWDDADPSIASEVESAIRKVESLGGRVRTVQLPNCELVYEIFQAGGLGASELSAFLLINMPEKIARLDPVVKMRVEGAESISSVEYLRRCAMLTQASLEAARFFEDVDAVLTPTIAISPPKVATLLDPAAYRQANMAALRNASIANLMGLCALSMPIGQDSQHMPVGLQLMCGPKQENKLLEISTLLEKKLGKPFDVLGTPPVLKSL